MNLEDWLEANAHTIAGLGLLVCGIGLTIVGRVDVGLSKDITGFPARLLAVAATAIGMLLLATNW